MHLYNYRERERKVRRGPYIQRHMAARGQLSVLLYTLTSSQLSNIYSCTLYFIRTRACVYPAFFSLVSRPSPPEFRVFELTAGGLISETGERGDEPSVGCKVKCAAFDDGLSASAWVLYLYNCLYRLSFDKFFFCLQ